MPPQPGLWGGLAASTRRSDNRHDGNIIPDSGAVGPSLLAPLAALAAVSAGSGAGAEAASTPPAAEPDAAAVDIWAMLADRLDLGAFVPVPTPTVEVREVEGRGGERFWVLRTPTPRYLRLDATDLDLWQRMDGRRTVYEIAVEHFADRGGFVADRLTRLVRRLRADGFLGRAATDVFGAVDHQIRRGSRVARLVELGGRAVELDLIRVTWADRAFSLLYRAGGWLLYVRPARVLWVLIIVAGLAAWWRQVLLAEHALLQTNGSYTLGLLTLAFLDFGGIALYQSAQGLRMKHHNIRILSAGVQLNYLLPMIFVETTDVWMADRRARMAVSASGPFAVLVLGGALALIAYPLDGTEMGAFLFKASFVWLVNGVFNLLPILGLDGYFLLADYLEMPALRANALTFVREGLVARLRTRVPFTREERIYATYGLGYALLVALIPLLILEARDLRYASSFGELWQRPDPGGQMLAAGMVVFLFGPAVFAILASLGQMLLAIGTMAYRRWRQARGEVPREHLEALAALPFLADVPRSDLRRVAVHLTVEEAETGQVIVRQGGHGDRFFVILDGQVRVVRIAADEHEERLATLGAGDYFGEAALAANVPRTATVIAETPVRLLSLDAGHFRRWLATRVETGVAVHRSLAERDQLAALPLCAGLGPAELDRLAARVLVTRYSAGDDIVTQGDPGDRFYVIIDGRVEVLRLDDDGSETKVAELGVGDYFGEMALLHREPRSATVRALSPVEAYTLTADDFLALVDGAQAAEQLRGTARRRMRELAHVGGGGTSV
jgi:CRP-like cAMP-binding protein/Zn-dependent protease